MEDLISIRVEVKVFGKEVKLSRLAEWLKRNKALLISLLPWIDARLFS